MKMIPSNVPVFIQDLESKESDRYSTAKLKVFYQGETADHRLFTKEFSDKIIQTLPSTPVVGYYSEKHDDFIGHNTTQYVYGHVPENASIYYEKDEDSGNVFAITDVILYTERKDNIGTVAKKIVGKQHSLELDPGSLKYKINRNYKGEFENIEFLEGQFIGLSVLGDDETPAFTGSGFFKSDENFKNFSEKCHENFDKFLNFLNNNGGKIQVFNSVEFFNKTSEFLSTTMQDFQKQLIEALDNLNKYGFLCENTEEYAIFDVYDQETENWNYIKYSITTVDDKIQLSNPVEVKIKFLTDEQIKENNFEQVIEEEKEENVDFNNTDPVVEDAGKEDKAEKLDEPTVVEDSAQCASVEEDDKKEDEDEDEKQTSDDTDDDNKKKEKEEDEMGNATASDSVAALSDSERDELEEFRRSAKIAIINSYVDELDNSILDEYKNQVDSFSKDELEAKLAIAYRNSVKNNKIQEEKAINFATIASANNYDETNPADVVKKYNR